jgi:hypothetical protein
MTGYHLAEINVGRLRAPVDHPMIADFKDNLDRINALADGQPGFVWRLQGEGNNATDNVKRILNLPENYSVLSIVALGHKLNSDH